MARQYQDNETRRRQVAEAALQTIVEDGVSKFTVRAVADRVGISDGTLFRHFGSKQDIILEAMTVLEIDIDAGMRTSDDAMADLEHFFRHRARFVGAQDAVGALVFSSELVHLAGDEGRARVATWRVKSLTFLFDCLSRLHEAGKTNEGVPLQGLGMIIQGTLLTFVMERSLRSLTPEELEERIEQAWSVLKALIFV